MSRYLVTMCDTNSGEIHSCFFSNLADEQEAILHHCWLIDVYTQKYINNTIRGETAEQTIQNIWSNLAWAISVVNLDEEIMKDLNGGDSNVSSQTPQD